MATEKQKVDAYVATVLRMEPDIAMVDRDGALASIAISLRRIADRLDKLEPTKGPKVVSLFESVFGPERK